MKKLVSSSAKSTPSNIPKRIFQGKGRHDPCVVPRAVPIVEAMAALTIADFWLANKLSKL